MSRRCFAGSGSSVPIPPLIRTSPQPAARMVPFYFGPKFIQSKRWLFSHVTGCWWKCRCRSYISTHAPQLLCYPATKALRHLLFRRKAYFFSLASCITVYDHTLRQALVVVPSSPAALLRTAVMCLVTCYSFSGACLPAVIFVFGFRFCFFVQRRGE